MIKQHKLNIYPLKLAITIITVLILILLTTYNNIRLNNALTDSLKTESYNSLGELTSTISKGMSASLKMYESSVSFAANALDHIENHDERIKYLNELALTSMDITYGIADLNGNLTIIGINESIDIRSEEFYKTALNGESSISTSNTILSRISPAVNIVIAKPVTEFGSDSISNVLCGFIKPSSIINSFKFDTSNIQVLLSSSNNGIIAYSNSDYESENSLTPLYQLVSTPEFTDNFSQVSEESEDSLYIHEYDKYTQYIYRTPAVFSDWVLYISILFEPEYNNSDNYGSYIVITNIIFTILIVIALLIYIIPVVRNNGSQRVAESRSMMLANLSHELKTPLNTIIGVSDILARSELKSGQLKEVSYISEAGNNLLAMINDILDVTKIESGKFELVDEEYDFESIIYDLTTVASVRLGNKPVYFLVNIASYVPRYMIGDMQRVSQLLRNIVTNAVKYTEKGHIMVTIDCDFIDQAALKLVVKVTDTGIGISKNNLAHLFDSFSRFDSLRNKKVEGTGLGMAIAKQFAELMHGNIEVQSVYGEGSEFTVSIMQRVAKTEPLVPALDNSSIKYENVLILEPSPLLRNYYASCLEDSYVNYSIASDNYEFSSLLSETEYEFIIADIDTIKMLSDENAFDKSQLITLVYDHAGTINDDNTLFVPLFPIQINSYLCKDARNLKSHNSHQSFLIHPMPDKRILIVDDNDMNLQVATGIMKPYKMKTDCAESGSKAIEMIKNNDYDLVFMDHMMPGMDGEETLHAIRKLKGDSYKTLPVIVLTANASQGAKEMFIDMGFQDFIPKPLEIRTLHNKLNKWLKPDMHSAAVEYRVVETDDYDSDDEANDDIDFKEGLSRIGSMPIYLKTLKNFSNTITKKLDIIRQSFPDDMKTFVIEVHGLKGLAATVSANKLAAYSLKLENMGKDNDIEGIRPLLDEYYEYMLKVKDITEELLSRYS